MLQGISSVILKKIRELDTASGSGKKVSNVTVQEITSVDVQADIHSEFNLDDLNIEGMTKEEAEHVGALMKKYLADAAIEDEGATGEDREKRRKTIPLQIEQHMKRYLTEKEKELLGVLVNRLV